MNLTIHIYGHIDSMFYILNGLAMLINHQLGQAITILMALLSAAYYAMRIAYAGQLDYKIHLGKVTGMMVMIYLILTPQGSMKIYDHISKKTAQVDNLPLGFALPVGLLEEFGHLLTRGFEQAFTMVHNANYDHYGMVFGARLIQESKNWRIRSPEFVENISNFIDRCVVVEAMIGCHYTLEELLSSDNIWHLIKTNAASIRQTNMRVGRDRILMTCRKAASEVIEPALRSEATLLEIKYANTEFGAAGSAFYTCRTLPGLNTNLKKNIELSFDSYLSSKLTAEQLMRQQMMIGALGNYRDDYGLARAISSQESNWFLASDLASTYLPILMSVFKGLVYSSFIFMLPLLLLSGGWHRYLSYLTLIASFALWAPLNAVLSMFIDLYSSKTLTGIADSIVSFSTMSRVGDYTDKIVAVASGLQMTIPFLAFSIINSGASSAGQIASHLGSASQSAAAQAASESVTGNKSFDNYAVGNQQLYHQGGFKTDWNESYAAGQSARQHSDGGMEKVTGLGNTLIQSGAGLTASSGLTSYRREDSRNAEVREGAQAANSLSQQHLRSASACRTSTIGKAADFISHLAQREQAGESFNYESAGEQGKTLQQAVSRTQKLHKEEGCSWSSASRSSVGINTPVIGVSMQSTAGSHQSNSTSSDTDRYNQIQQNQQNLIKAASNSHWAKENSIDTAYSDSVKASYEEQQRLEAAAIISQHRADDWHQAQNIVQSQSATSSRDMYQEVVEGIKQQYGTGTWEAQRLADSQSAQAQKVWRNLQKNDHYVRSIVADIGSKKAQISVRAAQQLKAPVNQDPAAAYEHAKPSLQPGNIKHNIDERRRQLQSQYQGLSQDNADSEQSNINSGRSRLTSTQPSAETVDSNWPVTSTEPKPAKISQAVYSKARQVLPSKP